MNDMAQRFRVLHQSGFTIMPNPWDIGSARMFESMGFAALATTSSGHAATLGKRDQTVSRAEMLTHVRSVTAAVDVPVNVDSERCGETPGEITETVALLAGAGAAGCSIEDYNPATESIDGIEEATARVAAAADAARQHDMVLTARCENLLYGLGNLDDTINRLLSYRDAGAEVVYAPGLVDIADIERVVRESGVAVNVLAMGNGPTMAELREAGVRRVSTGGALARVALAAAYEAAGTLLKAGTVAYADRAMDTGLLYRLLGR